MWRVVLPFSNFKLTFGRIDATELISLSDSWLHFSEFLFFVYCGIFFEHLYDNYLLYLLTSFSLFYAYKIFTHWIRKIETKTITSLWQFRQPMLTLYQMYYTIYGTFALSKKNSFAEVNAIEKKIRKEGLKKKLNPSINL